MTGKIKTLSQLVSETYTAHETKWFVCCDDGNGCGFGTKGQGMAYDEAADARYGALQMHATAIHESDDHVECTWASDWIEGENGYRYQVRF